MPLIIALCAGVVFGAGLTISDMINPARVLNFLDLAGTWDPSLIFVMIGALAVTAIGYRFAQARSAPFSPRRSMRRRRALWTRASSPARSSSELAGDLPAYARGRP